MPSVVARLNRPRAGSIGTRSRSCRQRNSEVVDRWPQAAAVGGAPSSTEASGPVHGLLRSLKPRQKARVMALRTTKGVRAANAYVLVSPLPSRAFLPCDEGAAYPRDGHQL